MTNQTKFMYKQIILSRNKSTKYKIGDVKTILKKKTNYK